MRCSAFVNGTVYASFKPLEVHQAVVVCGERFLFVGSEARALTLARWLGARVIDLEGKVVVPGFVDAHLHLDGLGNFLHSLDLRGTRSIEELKRRLREFATRSADQWIVGRGWDQELFEERRWPTRFDLDEVVRDRPVVLTRVCGHVAVLNTKAMEELRLMEMAGDPDVVVDEEGIPTGLVRERVLLEHVRARVQPSFEELKRRLVDAMNYVASRGVTAVGFVSCTRASFKALQELNRERGGLPVRVFAYLTPDALGSLSSLGIRLGFGTPHLVVNGVKVFIDGTLGARTAWLTEPYADAPHLRGRLLMPEGELHELASKVSEQGLQLAAHAIGDAAIDVVLAVYRRLGSRVRELRHRIEHASLVREDQIAEIAKLGARVAIQPGFALSDRWAVSRVGEDRIRWLYPFASLARAGVKLGISTDAPVEDVDPWATIRAAVVRSVRGQHPGSVSERLELNEVLHLYTLGSAECLHAEDRIGVIRPGAFADFVVLDRDPLKVGAESLSRVRVLETYVGGVRVYPTGG